MTKCDSLYIGETGRKLEKRLAEHSKGHIIDWDDVKVLEKEPRDFPRNILEAIHIIIMMSLSTFEVFISS